LGFSIDLVPAIGLGFCLHFSEPILEIAFGPFIIRLGDIEKLDGAEDED